MVPGGSVGKESTCNVGDHLQCRRCWFNPWVGKIPWRMEKATHSYILAWRIPWTCISTWGHKESDTTESLSLSLFKENFSQAVGKTHSYAKEALHSFLRPRCKSQKPSAMCQFQCFLIPKPQCSWVQDLWGVLRCYSSQNIKPERIFFILLAFSWSDIAESSPLSL